MKYNLENVSFLLIARFDTMIRFENMMMVVTFLNKNFTTNIHLWEYASYCNGIAQKQLPENVQYRFITDTDPILHRTKCINEMVQSVSTPYVAIWDIDVITLPKQIIQSVKQLESGIDFSYPYEKDFCDTSYAIRKLYYEYQNEQLLLKFKPFMNTLYNPNPVGGAFFARRDSYIECGMENEAFYGWGIEDGERNMRWKSRNKSIMRVNGPLFHLSHPRGINSLIPDEDSAIMKKRIYLSTIRGTQWLRH